MEQRQNDGKRLLFLKNWVVENAQDGRAAIDQMVESVKKALQPTQERLFEFKVVVNELINNEFMHGSGKDVRASVSVYSTKRVELCVYGTQEGFDLQEELQKQHGMEATGLNESGRGLVLAEALCENLRVDFACGGSIVRARIFMG